MVWQARNAAGASGAKLKELEEKVAKLEKEAATTVFLPRAEALSPKECLCGSMPHPVGAFCVAGDPFSSTLMESACLHPHRSNHSQADAWHFELTQMPNSVKLCQKTSRHIFLNKLHWRVSGRGGPSEG